MIDSGFKPQVNDDFIPPLPFRIARWQGWRWPGTLAILSYTLLTVVITFPLVFQLSDHILGGQPFDDGYQNLWYMWWYGRALEQGLDPTRTNLMYGLLPDVQVLVSSVYNGLVMWPFVKRPDQNGGGNIFSRVANSSQIAN